MENNVNRFYVYAHRRAANGEVFYIGKGCGNRHTSAKKRNPYWRNVAKHGWYSEILKDGLAEHCAFSIERMYIAALRNGRLTNLTDGGEGASGYVHSEQQRLAASIRQKGKPMPENIRSPEAKRKRAAKMKGRKLAHEHKIKISASLKGKPRGGKKYTFYNPTYGSVTTTAGLMRSLFALDGNIARVASGKIRSSKGWCLREKKDDVGHRSGLKHHNVDKRVHSFFHKDHGRVSLTRFELSKSYGISIARVGQLVRGEKPSCGGWRYV